ncbi:tuftelin-interacting protein 11-like [Babylonia areolata]|uniref:tuftelin-interacting protein 11-like n=1 Tax=Babylonia areolata TaxID=304850 RepID=UPI003FD0FBBF
MSSPEVERFEVTDDDLGRIFEPGSRRFRQSKNQATYGIWADESDEEDARPGFGGRQKKNKDFTSGINFVSGGFKKSAKAEAEEAEKRLKEEEEDGSSAPQVRWSQKKGSSKEGMRFLKGHHSDRSFGNWEKHTRGIGQKLLEKMGYRPGEGLGKEGQGITTPVEAVKRKGRATIGAYGSERTERSLKDYPVVDQDVEEDKKFQEDLQQWKRQPETKKQKPKYVYKTAQELIDSGVKQRKKMPSSVGPKVKVIDMTGKEKRVLSGYHAIGKVHDRPDEEEEVEVVKGGVRSFDMPELVHNLSLLVDMTEEDIVLNERRLRHNEDRLVNLKYEEDRLDTQCRQEEEQLNKLSSLLEIVKSCEERTQKDSENPLTLDECVSVFKVLRDEFHSEYKLYELSAISIAIIFPLVKDFLSKWDVLRDPSYGVMTMQEWRLLLEDESSALNPGLADVDPYYRLLWDVWLPPVRATILKWNPREYQPLIAMLEAWQPALVPWIVDNILDQLVLPRLLQEVENWNPLTDTMPIHSWLHPWLPFMGERLEPLYAPIRHKLASALTSWHPSDVSAKIILEPWVGVFKQGHMDAFLVKNVLPKLSHTLEEMPITPHQQNLDPWRWVMAWKDIMPIAPMVTILDAKFFPKWLQVLVAWLSNMPNYNEITRWYLGWKAQFPEKLLQYPTVRDHMNKALDIMNQAVSGHFAPGMKENMAYFTHTERRQMDVKPTPFPPQSASAPPPPPPPPSRVGPEPSMRSAGASTVPLSFRDLVQKRAEEENLLFAPVPGKTQEGHQVYRLGKAMVYIDRNVMFMQETNFRWVPVSLQTVIDKGK